MRNHPPFKQIAVYSRQGDGVVLICRYSLDPVTGAAKLQVGDERYRREAEHLKDWVGLHRLKRHVEESEGELFLEAVWEELNHGTYHMVVDESDGNEEPPRIRHERLPTFVEDTTPTRENVIKAFKEAFDVVPAKKVGSVHDVYGFAYTDKIPEFERADRLYDKWKAAEEKRLGSVGMSKAQMEFMFNDMTIFWDAGKNGSADYLDELANDWLMQAEYSARESGFTELADRMKQKIDEINQHLNHN